MRKLIQLLLMVVILPVLAIAQTPKRIHDLKSLTDSSGTVHLFYRVYAEYEGTEYYTDNIYHYNTETRGEDFFLEDYYDTHLGFEYQILINGYKFFVNNPFKFIYYGSDNDGLGFITRYDSASFMGGLTFPEHLEVVGTDSSLVYATFAGYGTFKSLDGGITWPVDETIREDNVPDSVKLDFPLISMSPYDDSLMFGVSTTFQRSTDAGTTNEVISDTLFPYKGEISFDADSNYVYLINAIKGANLGSNCAINSCSYGFYHSSERGAPGSWKWKKAFSYQVDIEVNSLEQGEIYIWNKDSIFVSNNYGESFGVLFHSEGEVITGMAAEGEHIFISTISSLYQFENGSLVLLREIPISNEEELVIPHNVQLYQNYPNPFNPATNIQFELPGASTVSLKVYDALGREVATLVNGNVPAGKQTIRFDASTLANGMYLYKLRVDNQEIVRKMTLIK